MDDEVPHSSNTDPDGNPMNEAKDENNISDIAVTLNLMQDFMVQKGLIKNTMNEQQIPAFLNRGKEPNLKVKKDLQRNTKQDGQTRRSPSKDKSNGNDGNPPVASNSEATIYSRAVTKLVASYRTDVFLNALKLMD